MNRWGVRILGILMILAFILVFMHMHKQLKALQKMKREQPAKSP